MPSLEDIYSDTDDQYESGFSGAPLENSTEDVNNIFDADTEESTEQSSPASPDTLLSEFLQASGIDPEAIMFDGDDTAYNFFDLDYETQKSILDHIKENNAKIKVVQGPAREVQSYEDTAYSIDDFSDEDVYAMYLRQTLGDSLSDEKLLQRLEFAQQDEEIFAKEVESIRNSFRQQEEYIAEQKKQQEREHFFQQLEEERGAIVKEVAEIKSLFGFPVDDDLKNELLESLVEIDQEGDSAFIKEVLGNPKLMAASVFALKHLPSLMQDMEAEYESKIQQAYEQGRNEALGRMPSRPVNMFASSSTQTATSKQDAATTRNFSTLDDLYS